MQKMSFKNRVLLFAIGVSIGVAIEFMTGFWEGLLTKVTPQKETHIAKCVVVEKSPIGDPIWHCESDD